MNTIKPTKPTKPSKSSNSAKPSKYSHFSLEYGLLQEGYASVAGIDEVGRGCLAGPVVAAAVVISNEKQYIPGVWDSKVMTRKMREDFYQQIMNSVDSYCIGECSCEEIDEMGLGKAASLAMRKAYEGLKLKPDVVLIDGIKIETPTLPNKRNIQNGDRLHFIIAAASVIAKVYRDNIMMELANKYKGYGFERNMGYGTKEHKDAIGKIGLCEIHRKSFSPVRKVLEAGGSHGQGE